MSEPFERSEAKEPIGPSEGNGPLERPTVEAFDPAARELCPDGACLGVIDEAGACNLCRTRADGAASLPAKEPADAEDSPAPDDERLLCPDGACIGLIGSDGRCKTCGRDAAGV